jgi:hypothetical protein
MIIKVLIEPLLLCCYTLTLNYITMKIKKVITQNRRDFTALMVCEFCNKESINTEGYDDRYYHDNVIPDMKCGSCLKSTASEGGEITHKDTKYSENQIV